MLTTLFTISALFTLGRAVTYPSGSCAANDKSSSSEAYYVMIPVTSSFTAINCYCATPSNAGTGTPCPVPADHASPYTGCYGPSYSYPNQCVYYCDSGVSKRHALAAVTERLRSTWQATSQMEMEAAWRTPPRQPLILQPRVLPIMDSITKRMVAAQDAGATTHRPSVQTVLLLSHHPHGVLREPMLPLIQVAPVETPLRAASRLLRAATTTATLVCYQIK